MKKKLIIIWSVVLLYVVYAFANYKAESKDNATLYEQIRDDFYTLESNKGALTLSGDEVNENKNTIIKDYDSIITINEDVTGWIKIPNTKIDYPVLKTFNNDFYLNNNINKKPSKAGSIFMDFRNKGEGSDSNTIIYGHNMKDASMFGELKKYKNKDFLEKNSVIEFNTLYEKVKWEVFSVYVTDVEFNYIKTDFSSLDEYKTFLESLKKKSIHNRNVELTQNDKILTLSTCSYERDNARFVVHAKRIL